ncbi:hypothetical protein DVH05_007375 [Phytophthora capsici]|nr:hypothetical protein DVH05_007375 [Phytophthora capsici]
MLSTLLYSLFQFVSFLLLVIVLKRKLGYSALEQLAFVLDAHAGPIQTKLNSLFVYIMQVALVHHGELEFMLEVKRISTFLCVLSTLGTDFTFQFAWLRSKKE